MSLEIIYKQISFHISLTIPINAEADMPNPKPNETVLSITIPTEAKAALEALAQLEDMPSVSALVRQLLENYSRRNGFEVSFEVGDWGGVRGHKPTELHPHQPASAHIADRQLYVRLMDGRQIITPLDWYPWLTNAHVDAQNMIELRANAVWWPLLDEGLSIDGMLRGKLPTPIQT